MVQSAYYQQITSLSKKNEENMRLIDQKEERIEQMEAKIKCLQGMNTF
jgi:TolA-binding protein